MKKNVILLLFSILSICKAYCQDINGRWFILDKDDMWEFAIKNDTMFVYPRVPFDLTTIKTPRLMGSALIFKDRQIKDGTVTCNFTSLSGGGATGVINLKMDTSQEKPRLFLSTILNDSPESIITPVMMVSEEEINTYARLKPVSEMIDDDFIQFATKVDALTTTYRQNRQTMSKLYLTSELKYIIAGLGYSPFISTKDLQPILKQFETHPKTAAIAKSYHH